MGLPGWSEVIVSVVCYFSVLVSDVWHRLAMVDGDVDCFRRGMMQKSSIDQAESGELSIMEQIKSQRILQCCQRNISRCGSETVAIVEKHRK